eukprot:5276492-Prymnesium_polylepis.1
MPVRFDFVGADRRELREQFQSVLEESVAAALTAAADAAAAEAAAAATDAAAAADAATTTTADAFSKATRERPLTARQRAGAELRVRLQEVVRLRNKNKTNEAAAALDAIPAGDMTTGAPGRAKELRNTTFTFGGLALTRDIVARFL